MNGYYESIGIACSCHATFSMVCVFEFGNDVEPLILRNPDGSLIPLPEMPELFLDPASCLATYEMMGYSSTGLDGSDYCNEIDYNVTDVYSGLMNTPPTSLILDGIDLVQLFGDLYDFDLEKYLYSANIANNDYYAPDMGDVAS